MTFSSKAVVSTFFLSTTAAHAFTLVDTSYTPDDVWQANDLRFFIDPESCDIPEADFREAVQKAFDVWNSVDSSRIKLSIGGVTSGSNLAAYMQHTPDDVPAIFCSSFDGIVTSSGVVGIGICVPDAGSGVPTDYGFVAIRDRSVAPLNTQGILASVIAHELGHCLGLGHSTDKAALMYNTSSAQDTKLAQDDILGITYLYPHPNNAMNACGTIATSESKYQNEFVKLILLMIPFVCILFARVRRRTLKPNAS